MLQVTDGALMLRKLTLADAPFIVRLLNEPSWLQYIGDRKVRTKADAETYLKDGPLAMYEEHGFGLYLVEYDRQPAGLCGLLKRETLPLPDLGFALLPEFAGRGLAYKASVIVLKSASEQFELESVCAITRPDNRRSISLLERLGFSFKREFIDHGEPLSLYSLALR
ncbi:MAG: GNAT family N-acetyltransferase [Pseudomonadota bacterium]